MFEIGLVDNSLRPENATQIQQRSQALPLKRSGIAAQEVVPFLNSGNPVKPLNSTTQSHEQKKEALTQFEAMVATQFVELMLKSSNSDFFGDGLDGEISRSFMAKSIGEEIAKDSGLGIRSSLLDDKAGHG